MDVIEILKNISFLFPWNHKSMDNEIAFLREDLKEYKERFHNAMNERNRLKSIVQKSHIGVNEKKSECVCCRETFYTSYKLYRKIGNVCLDCFAEDL